MTYAILYESAGLCHILPAPANGFVVLNDSIEGSTANYSCNSGYQLVGDAIRTCRDGQWTGTAPECKRMCLTCILNYR